MLKGRTSLLKLRSIVSTLLPALLTVLTFYSHRKVFLAESVEQEGLIVLLIDFIGFDGMKGILILEEILREAFGCS